MPSFDCQSCGKGFDVSQTALDKYPGWTPKICMTCKKAPAPTSATSRRSPGSGPRKKRTRALSSGSAEEDLTLAQVLDKYTDGPVDGVFTDGASHPNPGPGGWGAVYVKDGEVVGQAYGHEPDTTNNRMELTALIAGFKLVPPGTEAVVWTDSQLCVNTITKWAAGWKKNGWKRKTGPIKNLELVQELYALHVQRPELELRWIKAHSGLRWNEYADSLATAYRRSAL